jgi:hypothetical protein
MIHYKPMYVAIPCSLQTLSVTEITWHYRFFICWCMNKPFPCLFGVCFFGKIKMHYSIHLHAMCSCQDPLWPDDRTTTEICIANYKSNLPWELTTACSATTSDMVLIIQRHMDFPSKVYTTDKHISNQQQKGVWRHMLKDLIVKETVCSHKKFVFVSFTQTCKTSHYLVAA